MDGKNLSYSHVRKFVVDFYCAELADFMIFAAMKVPDNSLWVQSQRSKDWSLLNANTTKHEIEIGSS